MLEKSFYAPLPQSGINSLINHLLDQFWGDLGAGLLHLGGGLLGEVVAALGTVICSGAADGFTGGALVGLDPCGRLLARVGDARGIQEMKFGSLRFG